MMKKWIALLVLFVMILGMSACSGEPDTVVYVQNVGEIAGIGSIALTDKFAGVVVSENATKISRDYGRSISMLYVAVGQDVSQGDVLFAYDSEALELEVEKQQLELERMQQESTRIQAEITQLQTDQRKADKDEQLSYTLNIQEKQAALKQNEYNISAKKREIAQTQATLNNAQVLAPISGRVVAINDEDSRADSYITIQQAGTYRVKASLNELNRNVIFEGAPIRVTPRNGEDLFWTGTVSLVDMEGGSTGSNSNGGYGFGGATENEYGATTKYPFYVELDSMEGLMLGQHVFVEVDNGTPSQEESDVLRLPAYYILMEDETEGEARYFVWAENSKNRIERRYLTLGAFDEVQFTYEILEGLTADDYIAFPDDFCTDGVGTTRNPNGVVLPEETSDPNSEFDPEFGGNDFDVPFDPDAIDNGGMYPEDSFEDFGNDEDFNFDGGQEDVVVPETTQGSGTVTDQTKPTETRPTATVPSATVYSGSSESSDGDLDYYTYPDSSDGDIGG